MTEKSVVDQHGYVRSLFEKIPKEWRIDESPSDKRPIDSVLSLDEIMDIKPINILDLISKGELKSLQVVKSFAYRASIAHQLTNCLTEIFFEDAFQRAKELDDYFEKNGETIGPLHGLPISVKDEFDIKGVKTTLGLISRINDPAQTEFSPNLKILYDQGAVFFVKTNVPIGAFNRMTFNNLFGTTVSPYDISCNVGGSSGGEAALVSMKGSAFGIGSDLGGSIRQPAAFAGLYGLRTSSLRVPHYNRNSVVAGLESLKGTNGPITRDLDSLKLYLRTIIDTKPWLTNINVVPVEWNNNPKVDLKKLRVGVLSDDGINIPTPPIKRALKIVYESLKSVGVEIVEVKKQTRDDIIQLANYAGAFMESSGNTQLIEEIGNEPVSYLADLKSTKDLKVSELWKLHIDRDIIQQKILNWWNDSNVDVLISPITAQTFLKNDEEFIDCTYGAFVNMLDFPSITFPVTKVTLADFSHEVNDINESTKQIYESFLTSDKETYVDKYPVNIQIIARRYQEEYLIEVVHQITELIGTHDWWY
ncbi:hypothetical protein WICMUC_003952 [Wickerhamomyces mucosus]|uniref:amidase n=1 Tax=Wickerhamomyces mucosus TaxID=1378264 RepID=A0A9P8PKC9_9ASCO|nr:hypothetical protein WICMUC_003952 [Wickerhamomyces mucosus]